jgi:putative flippase GtrA
MIRPLIGLLNVIHSTGNELFFLQILGIIASFMLRYIVNRMATEGKVYDPVKTKSRA